MTAPSTMRRFQDHTPPFVAGRCGVPKCPRPVGPNRILCLAHYAVVPLCRRKPLNAARRVGDKAAEHKAARRCIESAGGPDA